MSALAEDNPIEMANLETYLFEKVGKTFREYGRISKEDFWLILIWKANRAKNNTRRALERDETKFEDAVSNLAASVFEKKEHQERLADLVMKKRLGLAMSSAILTVFYPDFFTVYDVRVCDQLNRYHKLKNCRHSERLWQGYQEFKKAVEEAVPGVTSLRDKDKTLWGRSLLEDVKKELAESVPERKPRKDKNIKSTETNALGGRPIVEKVYVEANRLD